MQEATDCELVIFFGATPTTLAKGMVHPPKADDQLKPNHLKVTVDKVTHEWAKRIPLPVPADDMAVLDDARHEVVQWPKNQIILDKVISK